MGFCIFNNVAIAAAHAVHTRGLTRVLIVDWDVHHGNGTQAAFFDDPRVLFFSVHRWDNGFFYPGVVVDGVGADAGAPTTIGTGAGAGFTVNLGWSGTGDYGAPAMGDADYAAAWERVLLPLAAAFRPQLILVSAGFDAGRGDPYGDCDLTPAGFAELTRALCGLGVPVVLALEGGYNVPTVKFGFGACVAALRGVAPRPPGASGLAVAAALAQPEALACIDATIRAHAPHWPCFQRPAAGEDAAGPRPASPGNQNSDGADTDK
jgi:histone deacetylase 6